MGRTLEKIIDCLRAIVKRSGMHIRHACVAVATALLLGASAPAGAASPEERRLVIVESPDNHLSKVAWERMRKAIGDVATGKGLTLVPSETMPARLLTCGLPGCLPSVAAASGAIFVLRVDARFAKESFKLAVELWNSDAGKLLGRERKDCPICDEQDLWGSAELMAQRLLDHALREPDASGPVPSAPAPAPAPRIAVDVSPPPSPTPPMRQRSPVAEYAGVALCAAGFVAVGVGAYYIAVDGEPATKDGDFERDTMKFGLPMTIGGGVALVTGAGLLAWSLWPGPAKVSVGPSGINLAGRF